VIYPLVSSLHWTNLLPPYNSIGFDITYPLDSKEKKGLLVQIPRLNWKKRGIRVTFKLARECDVTRPGAFHSKHKLIETL